MRSKSTHQIGRIASVLLLVLSSFTSFGETALPSIADYLKPVKEKHSIDHGWLPDLMGLPTQKHMQFIEDKVNSVMKEEDEGKCKSIDSNLRTLIFEHFLVYQHIANAQNVYFDNEMATRWGHVLGMILKESSGDSTNITDMHGHATSTYASKTTLDRWKQILNSTIPSKIHLTYQTNFGLTQTSADRLYLVFKLIKNQSYNTGFLEGYQGSLTQDKAPLNTPIAIRRLIWFYQDFAQGRITQWDERIPESDINKPEFADRYKQGLEMALLYCGTRHMFTVPDKTRFVTAMSKIAYCRLGNSQKGYGADVISRRCFAEWVTLCPALNIDIALITPLSYFQTRDEKPVCVGTFKKLIIKNPKNVPVPKETPPKVPLR